MTSRSIVLITLSTYLIISTQATPIPEDTSYIKACSVSDPLIDKCLVESANLAWNALAQGRPNLPSPSFVPYWDVPEVTGGQLEEGFLYTQYDGRVYGFELMNFIEAKYNKTEDSMFFTAKIPTLMIVATYKMDVQFLGQHIYGNDLMSALLENITVHIKQFLKTENLNGVEIYQPGKTSFTILPVKTSIQYENLFDGDTIKGDAANKLINENRKDFFKHVGIGWNKFMSGIVAGYFDKLGKVIPKDKFLRP